VGKLNRMVRRVKSGGKGAGMRIRSANLCAILASLCAFFDAAGIDAAAVGAPNAIIGATECFRASTAENAPASAARWGRPILRPAFRGQADAESAGWPSGIR
jgi:hypothetical protein